ncbi:uncharacterized protein LOC143912575 [Arctopsyche grandis]|uniref:uncharacterized protein LOC143912575 n=1 Tax=Arctopsyche grandis TaxID=121162 RepID=UPI00406D6C4B
MAYMSLKSIFRLVYDDETAVAFLQMQNILPRERLCANGHLMKLLFNNEGQLWRCYKRDCRNKKGIRKDTWLQNSRLPLDTVVHFIYCWANELTSIKFCARELEMSQSTVVDWNNYLREVCVWRVEQAFTEIGGEGMVVEIDESQFVRRGTLPRQWIFAGLCRETKECFVVKVPDCSIETLVPIIRERIRAGSNIVSDCWQAYKDISMNEYYFVDPKKFANTQQIWGPVKWGDNRRRGTHKDFTDSYLAEFIWRSKLNGRDPFETILQDISSFPL